MPGYQTRNQQVAVAGVPDLFIRSLSDRNQFADPFGDALGQGISSASWSLFGLLWPSALQLAARLALRPVRPSERILEIGCGLALASLVGHRRGADITASDCHPLAGVFLEENLRLNGLAAMKYLRGHWAGVAAWPQRDGPPVPEPVCERYDLIVGSDVLYDRDGTLHLAAFLGRHARPGGEVWIVDPDRGNRPAFNRVMADSGFQLHEERIDRAGSADAEAYKGRLLRYDARMR